MGKYRVIIVPDDLFERIDHLRGSDTRQKFLDGVIRELEGAGVGKTVEAGGAPNPDAASEPPTGRDVAITATDETAGATINLLPSGKTPTAVIMSDRRPDTNGSVNAEVPPRPPPVSVVIPDRSQDANGDAGPALPTLSDETLGADTQPSRLATGDAPNPQRREAAHFKRPETARDRWSPTRSRIHRPPALDSLIDGRASRQTPHPVDGTDQDDGAANGTPERVQNGLQRAEQSDREDSRTSSLAPSNGTHEWIDESPPAFGAVLASSAGPIRLPAFQLRDLSKYMTHLWIPAVLLFGLGDTLTSVLVFSGGGYEANPILATLVRILGGSVLAFVAVKTIALLGLMVTSYRSSGPARWLIPLVVAVLGLYLVSHNTASLL